MKYHLCQVLNLLVVIGLFFVTDLIFTGHFWSYGYFIFKRLLGTEEENVQQEIFPSRAKCRMKLFGKTGTISSYDFICVLNLNYLLRGDAQKKTEFWKINNFSDQPLLFDNNPPLDMNWEKFNIKPLLQPSQNDTYQ